MLLQDAVITERAVLCLITVPLTDDQFNALTSPSPIIWVQTLSNVLFYATKQTAKVQRGTRKLSALNRCQTP
ncbi:hypothetical protein [Bartonella vinsonii]|nr:hypothetical protein [Bartonella vinsonii]